MPAPTLSSQDAAHSSFSAHHKAEVTGGAPVLALIPARGGSKGLPRKNLAMLHGRPLLDYAIRCGLDSRWVDRTCVSSDDEEILRVGRELGAQTLRRPPEFATDAASAIDVVHHYIDSLSPQDRERNPFIIYLQPTSPLRTAADVDSAVTLMVRHGATMALSVVEMNKSPFKAFRLDDAGRLASLFDERLSNARRQDLPAAYMPNGAIYIFRVTDFLLRGGFPSNGSVPYVMDETSSVDIDRLDDLRYAEQLMGAQHG